MSTALEKYLVSIGHNGPYTDGKYNCGCSNNGPVKSAPIMVQDTQISTKPILTRSTQTIKNSSVVTGGAFPKAEPVQGGARLDIVPDPTYRPGMDPSEYGVVPPHIVATSDTPILVNNPLLKDVFIPSIENTGILPPELSKINLSAVLPEGVQTIDEIGIVNPLDMQPQQFPTTIADPIAQTGAQPIATNTVARNPSKAGSWFLGLLVAGIIVRKFTKKSK